MTYVAALHQVERDGVPYLTDPGAAERGVLVAFGCRRGGVSKAPFDSLNLAARVGDDIADVMANRARWARAAGYKPDRLALARQVHGCGVAEVGPHDAGVVAEADVLVARSPGPVGGILTADCAAVVAAGRSGVAVAHAGWRGLVCGAVQRAVEAVGPVWAAWVGPAVAACCYEVGNEVIEEFVTHGLPVAGGGRVDIAQAAAAALRRAGVENIALSGRCTACDERYFSYRRAARTGRQAAVACLLEAS